MPPKKSDPEWVKEHFGSLQRIAQEAERVGAGVVEPVRPWTVLKQLAVHNILGMYLGIISQQSWVKKRFFIDLNSSCGINELEGTGLRMAGTALIGAGAGSGFDHYFFVEPDAAKRSALDQRVRVFCEPDAYTIYDCGADDAVTSIMERIPPRNAHSFAIVDPYTLKEISWKGLSALMSPKRGDVLINFQTTHPKRAGPDISEAFMGTAAVRQLIDGNAPEERFLELFTSQVSKLRPKLEVMRVQSGGSSRYYYDLIYAVAPTAGNNPWLEKMVKPLRKRLERLDGRVVLSLLTNKTIDDY